MGLLAIKANKRKHVKGEYGGGGGIRTLEGLSPLPVFKTGAFNRSATPPQIGVLNQTYVNLISQPSY